MKTNHTPGPWGVNNCREAHHPHRIIIYGGPLRVALCYKENNGAYVDLAEAQANAKLIAAAPYLLEACREVVKGYEGDGMEQMQERDKVFYRVCIEAIQKATDL